MKVLVVEDDKEIQELIAYFLTKEGYEVDQADVLIGGKSASATPLSTGLGSTGIFSGSDSNLWAPESQLNTSAKITHDRDHEMAYLIRHFTESVGPW